jgi:hypothetical protein
VIFPFSTFIQVRSQHSAAALQVIRFVQLKNGSTIHLFPKKNGGFSTSFAFANGRKAWHCFRRSLIMKKTTKGSRTKDLTDNPRDTSKLKPEQGQLAMPDASEIAGQENVRPPAIGEMRDTTISSADEEGRSVFEKNEISTGESDVTDEERALLSKSVNSTASADDQQLENAELDETDDDGDPLNVKSDLSADDLDIPGSEDDDENEELGEEDEENNSYSLGGDRHDS